MNTPQPSSVADVQSAVCASRIVPRGGGTTPALCRPAEGWQMLDLTGLSGVLEYNPGEYTFTALAGTRLAEVQSLLAAHGQYLPFDPPFVERGATLGGIVASGLSGPGRYRYGGVRDFILGVRFVDGIGQLVHGGGKVVKNAAGFDMPKLMVGSLGQFGVLVELTFKVFPRSAAFATVQLVCPSLEAALAALARVYTARLDIDSLDMAPNPDGTASLLVRVGGLPEALAARACTIHTLLAGGEVIRDDAEAQLWRDVREFAWVPAGWTLVKVPVTPKRIAGLETALSALQALRRYSAGGNVAWIATPAQAPALDGLLLPLGLSGLVLSGGTGPVRIGARNGQVFEGRLKAVFDPAGRLPAR